jgi:hypothetical protein
MCICLLHSSFSPTQALSRDNLVFRALSLVKEGQRLGILLSISFRPLHLWDCSLRYLCQRGLPILLSWTTSTLVAASKTTMPRRNTKKSSMSITSHPSGAMQIDLRVDGTCHSLVVPTYLRTWDSCGSLDPDLPEQRPPRNRRVTRKVIEDATADVSLSDPLEVSNPVVAPSTNLSLSNEGNLIVAAHGTPLPNPGSTPSTERCFWAASPSVPSQTPRDPRRARHSVRFSVGRHCSPRLPKARSKNRHTANDVWTFFEDVESKRSCLFCK